RTGGLDEVIPLDLTLGDAGADGTPGRVLLVSGPNMGGKTVLLKTAGLCALLAHAALPVPCAEGSTVPELEQVVVDLGDEQSLDRGLSTFAAHLAAMADMARAAGPRTLVLADEVGAGTDPDEGGALARSLVEHLAAAGTWAVLTTHLGALKRLVPEVPGVVNGSLEFDPGTLRSRFRFVPGVPGASHALEVAERLGFPSELLARARALTPESTRALERLTQELAAATERARTEASALTLARAEAQSQAAAHHDATEHARRELAEARRSLTRESEALLARSRELWQVVQKEARRRDTTREDAQRLKRDVEQTTREVETLAAGSDDSRAAVPGLMAAEVVPGLRVRALDLGLEAEVSSAPDDEGRVQLKRGTWTIQTHVNRLARAADAAPIAPRPASTSWSVGDGPPPLEVDLRGMEADEALGALDAGLDRAVMAGLGEVRVIHGIGRGVLRGAVEKHLRRHPQVAEQRLGQIGEGGRGVTVARLR
ncbi:MAG: endonuclease MutS2, partial [Candidatus Eisenbacteria bacterium]|nr:endonuclease MutS2 [Candidatus Eisenbacteria bacterium]